MQEHKGCMPLAVTVNGEKIIADVYASTTLLRFLREHIGYTGSKPGCENGDCGACTVLVNDRPVKACMMLAVEVSDKRVTTVEGLQDTEIQKAFVTEGGFQCGYCTSGFIVNAFALLNAHPEADEGEKRNWLSANLCRCTGYEGISNALNRAQSALNSQSDK